MRLALLALAAALLVPAQEQDDLQKKLDTKVSVDMTAGLDKILDSLRASPGLSIILDLRVRERIDIEKPVELKLKDVTARAALRWIASLYGLEFATVDGAVVVGMPGQVGVAQETRMFEVSGLTTRPPDFPAPRADEARGANEPTPVVAIEGTGVMYDTVDFESDLIKQMVAPGTWEGSATITALQPGRLAVHHYPEALAQVDKLVLALRKLAPAMLTIEADLLDLDEAAAKKIDALPSSSLDDVAVKALIESLQPLRRAKSSETLRFTCTEGQLMHIVLNAERAVNTPGGSRPEVVKFPSSTVLEVRPVLAFGGKRIKLDLALRSHRLAEPMETAKVEGWDVDLPESTEVAMRSTSFVANGGALVFLLPRSGRDARAPRAMILRASASGQPADDLLLDAGTPADAAVAAKIEALGPVDVDFRQSPAAQAFDSMREKLGVNLVIDPELLARQVTFSCKGVKGRSLLALLCAQNGWVWSARDGAVYVRPASRRSRDYSLFVADIRDLGLGLRPAQGGELAVAYNPDEVATLIKNSVERDRWDEADGCSVSATPNGLLVVRNQADVVRHVRAFLETCRRQSTAMATMRGELVTLKADALDDLLSKAEPGSYLADADAVARVLSAATAPPERIQLDALLGQHISLTWTRHRTIATEGRLIHRAAENHIDFVATAAQGVLQVTVALDAQELTVAATEETRTPLSAGATLRTTIALPAGKAGLFKLGAGDGGTVKVLLLRASARD